MRPVSKNRFYLSNYRSFALTFSVSSVFGYLLSSSFLQYINSFSSFFGHHYGFCKEKSTINILSHITDVWLSSSWDLGISCRSTYCISGVFDGRRHRGMSSKHFTFGFHSSLSYLIFSFLFGYSISLMTDKSNSSFSISNISPQGSVLPPVLLFLNDYFFFNSWVNLFHSYTDDSTRHSSTTFRSALSSLVRFTSRLLIKTTLNSALDRISQGGGNKKILLFLLLKLHTFLQFPLKAQ